MAKFGDSGFQFSLQHQGEEAAEHMAADGFVEPVEDRPGCQQVLGGAEGLLDAPELLVAQHRRQRSEIGVGAQHEEVVEAGIVIRLGAIDGEVAFARGLEEAAIAGVANQRLVALAKLPFQRGPSSTVALFG